MAGLHCELQDLEGNPHLRGAVGHVLGQRNGKSGRGVPVRPKMPKIGANPPKPPPAYPPPGGGGMLPTQLRSGRIPLSNTTMVVGQEGGGDLRLQKMRCEKNALPPPMSKWCM